MKIVLSIIFSKYFQFSIFKTYNNTTQINSIFDLHLVSSLDIAHLDHTGYICLDRSNNKYFISMHWKFLENSFSLALQTQSNHSSPYQVDSSAHVVSLPSAHLDQQYHKFVWVVGRKNMNLFLSDSWFVHGIHFIYKEYEK